jgi:TolA-binding protein
MARIFFLAFAVCFFLFLPRYPIAQTSNSQKIADLEKLVEYTSEIEFQYALEEYVKGLFVNYGEERIPQEYFLISLMQLISKEYSSRLEHPDQARRNYFSELKTMLDEIYVLKQRLHNAGINELSRFISDLEGRIKFTINSSEINFKKKKVFEDALQMLYVAEEMIKLDQLQQPNQTVSLNQKLSESKKEILTAFGEVSTGVVSTPGKGYTIYDLFSEWKKLDERKYTVRLTDVKLARQNLLKATDTEGVLRMLNAELKMAYDYFNGERYDLCERLLGDVIDTYPSYGVRNLEDVHFYRAESNFALNRLLHAETMFQGLLQDYPTTEYLAQIYKRLVQINYTLEKYSNTIKYSDLFQSVSSQADPDFFDVQFLSAMASYQSGDFGRAIDLLSTIPKDHPYRQISLYFTANAYSASQRYDEAISLYLQLSDEKNITPSLYHQTLYKIAIIEFERKNYFATIKYLSKIPETFIGYDKVLNAFAWAYYEYEQTKPENEPRDFYFTKYYANRLLDEFYASPYKMEARSLVAYISQLEDRPSRAMELYRNIYQTKLTKSKVNEYIAERKRYDEMFQEANNLKALAFEKGDKKQYLRAIDLMDELETEMVKMDLTEISGLGLSTYSELNSVISQLEELSRLRDVAELNEEYEAVQRIDNLRLHLLSVLNEFPAEMLQSAERVNIFDEYPISKLVAEEENRSEQYTNNRLEINEEMGKIEAQLADLEKTIQQAKSGNEYEKVAELESQRDRFLELQKDGDNLLSATYMTDRPEDVYPEFSKWGDFGAFGIINVQFFQKQQMQRDITEIALGLDKVNKDLESRKQVIEDKIKKIEAEVRFMTMKARVEERARQRAERERAFREGYFDTRTSESEPQ